MEVTSAAQWRRWLADHHRQSESVWVVTYKKASGAPHVSYAEIRDEALCFGWIDSAIRTLDERRSRLLLSPRRPGSAWSAVNKARIEALTAAGRMAPPGAAAVARAKTDGSWSALDVVETLEPPEDLVAALRAAGAEAIFAAFAKSSRRGILEWIANAKRAETRANRIAETARLAAKGLRANFPEAKGQ